nr:hypothetical protein [Porticoccaceae bacterium]
MAKEPRLKRIDYYGEFEPRPVDTYAAQQMQALAGLGKKMSDISTMIGKKVAQGRGEKEGLEAAKTSRVVDEKTGEITYKPVETRTFGWSADAFNNSALSATKSQIVQDSRIRVAELSTEFKDDPEGFQKASSAYMDGVVSSMPEEIQPLISESISGRIHTNQVSINTEFQRKTLERSIGTHTGNIETGGIEVTRLARIGDTEGVERELVEVISDMNALAVIHPDFDIKSATNGLKNKIRQSTEMHTLEAMYEKDEENEGAKAYAYLDELSKNVPKGVAPEEWRKFISQAQTDLNSKKTRLKNATVVDAEEQENFLNGYFAQVEMGTTLNPNDTIRAEKIVKGTANEKKLADAHEVSAFVASDLATRQQLMADAEALGVDGAEVLQKMQAAQYKIDQALAKDPMGFAFLQKAGGIGESQLDVLEPTAEQLTERRRKAKLVSQHYYGRDVGINILTDAESDSLVKYFNSPDITPEEQASIAKIYGDDDGIWGAFADKNQGVYAQAATHTNPLVSAGIFDGQYALKTGTVKVDAKDKASATNVFNDYLGSDTVPDQDYKDLLDSSMALYASGAGQGQPFDSDAFESAVKSVVGNVGTVRGERTFLPDGVSEKELEDYFDNMTNSEFVRSV